MLDGGSMSERANTAVGVAKTLSHLDCSTNHSSGGMSANGGSLPWAVRADGLVKPVSTNLGSHVSAPAAFAATVKVLNESIEPILRTVSLVIRVMPKDGGQSCVNCAASPKK